MDNAVFGKTMENVKLVTTEARNSYLVSEPTYHTAIFFFFFFEKFISYRNEKNIDTHK